MSLKKHVYWIYWQYTRLLINVLVFKFLPNYNNCYTMRSNDKNILYIYMYFLDWFLLLIEINQKLFVITIYNYFNHTIWIYCVLWFKCELMYVLHKTNMDKCWPISIEYLCIIFYSFEFSRFSIFFFFVIELPYGRYIVVWE